MAAAATFELKVICVAARAKRACCSCAFRGWLARAGIYCKPDWVSLTAQKFPAPQGLMFPFGGGRSVPK
jgi:hypothetical protein